MSAKPLRGLKEAPRGAQKSKMDTMVITPAGLEKWKKPRFQRPLKVNAKVKEISEGLKANGGVIDGVITLGVFDGDWYIVDGQHRLEAFRLSELEEGLCDVRIVQFESMADMAVEFERLQSSLVRFIPDDKLRSIEEYNPAVGLIRQRCKFVGYDQIRRGEGSPIVSMSLVLRSWFASAPECPAGAMSASELGKLLTDDEAHRIVDFLTAIGTAWGRDPEYYRLWSALNLTIVAWLWRRTVTGQYSPKTTRLTKDAFTKCCMALSANGVYLDWLVGRNLGDRDRSPCYTRIKQIFAARLVQDGIAKPYLPSPAW